MTDKIFTMSQFASKADLYEAKSLYLQQEYDKMRNVAVLADQIFDEFSYAHPGSDTFQDLGKALMRVDL